MMKNVYNGVWLAMVFLVLILGPLFLGGVLYSLVTGTPFTILGVLGGSVSGVIPCLALAQWVFGGILSAFRDLMIYFEKASPSDYAYIPGWWD